MKAIGDRAFCEGMNRVVVHGWSHNPGWIDDPGIVYGAGTHYNDKRIWWPMIKPFNQYLARVSNVFQKTQFVADVLYYYGDAVPNYTGHKNSRFMVGPGFDYEVINNEILLQLEVKNGNLVLPTGAEFKLLALEPEERINPEILQKVKDLAEKGATIVSEKPQGILPHRKDIQIKDSKKMIDDAWVSAAEIKSSKPKKVVSEISPRSMLERMGILPDISYQDNEFFLIDYIHYKQDDHDYFFIRNTTDQWLTRNCSFRQPGKSPEIWDPVSGEIVSPLIYNQNTSSVDMPLTLAPYGSVFVVFSPGSESGRYSSITDADGVPARIIHSNNGIIPLDEGILEIASEGGINKISNYIKKVPIDGAWEVYFKQQAGSTNRYIYPELISWTASENEAIKYYSGIANYVKTFQFDINSVLRSGKKIFLDLGDFTKVARVSLNGTPIGICWTKPYLLEVTNTVKAGDNTLEIEIANTWSNRLVGDAHTNTDIAFTNITSTNIDGLNKQRVPWKDVPLIKSGLFGPVQLLVYSPIGKEW